MGSSRNCRRAKRFTPPFVLVIGIGVFLLSAVGAAQRGGGGNGGNNPIASLKGVAVPQPADVGRYVADPQALVVLGKALFWDAQIGSDGRTACASCHFHAGADHRVTNQIAGPATSTAAVRPITGRKRFGIAVTSWAPRAS